jgi:hypothetical protein
MTLRHLSRAALAACTFTAAISFSTVGAGAAPDKFTIEIRDNAPKDVELFTKGTHCENGGQPVIRAAGRHVLTCPLAAVKANDGQYVHIEIMSRVQIPNGSYTVVVCVVQYARGTISAFTNPDNHCTINGISEFASLITVHTTR